jgi:coenzyme F420-reducing hydrogenase beta subunit
MIDKVSAEQCVLCGSCRNACPVDAISFSNQYLDFVYPKIDAERCIKCNRCERACPVLKDRKSGDTTAAQPTACAARNLNDEIRRVSTSGGLFHVLASHVLVGGGCVCGAVFDERFRVRHIVSDSPDDVRRMMGSKYAQSDMGMCYREIKEQLAAGRQVLFSGCPCQVAGLRAYLDREYPNLLLVELICHGIPSAEMLGSYIAMREKQYGAKLRKLEFRNKDEGWHRSAVRMEFENGKVYRTPITEDEYMNGFLNSYMLKPSCYDCRFRNFTTGCDIALGDFWGIETMPSWKDDNRGTSAVLVNTEKGRAFLEQLPLERKPCSLDEVIQFNKSLVCSSNPHPQRAAFYAWAELNGYASAIRHFLRYPASQRIKKKARYRLRCLRNFLQGREKPFY